MSYTNYREKKEIRNLFSQIQKALSEQMEIHQKDPEAELFCGDICVESMTMNPGTKIDDVRLTFLLPIYAVRESLTEKKIEESEIMEALYDHFNVMWDEDETGIHLTPMVEFGGERDVIEMETLDRRRKKMIDEKLIRSAQIIRCEKDPVTFCGLIEFDGILCMKNVDRFVSFARNLPIMILKTLAYGEEFFYDIHPVILKSALEVETVFTFPPKKATREEGPFCVSTSDTDSGLLDNPRDNNVAEEISSDQVVNTGVIFGNEITESAELADSLTNSPETFIFDDENVSTLEEEEL